MAIPQEVKEALKNHIEAIESQTTTEHVPPTAEASFYIADLNEVVRKWALWREALPDVTPFYAVKSSYDPRLIQTLAACGAGFDCASAEEIELILSLGIGADRIIFTHPCKPVAAVGLCRKLAVNLVTFDNECELHKLKRYFPEAHLVLRVFADDPTNVDPLGTKFGAAYQDFQRLVSLVKKLDMHLAGASFHAAPSVATNSAAYVRGIRDAALVFALAQQAGLKPWVLDIGGGYTDTTFREIAESIKPTIADSFEGLVEEGCLRVLAEPGTFFSCSPFYLAVKVVGRRRSSTAFGEEPKTRLYINDGIYSSFMMHFIVQMRFSPVAVISNGTLHEQTTPGETDLACSIWGRSCDSNDCINRDCRLNREVNIGDWLVFKDMGAYTAVCNTAFNGFTSSNHTIYLESVQVDKVASAFKPLCATV